MMMGSSSSLMERVRAATEFVAPAVEELLPDLSREEQLRLQNQLREREKRHNKKKNQPSPPPSSSERQRDLFIIPQVHCALHHYNVRHPGDEFEAVKPLMQQRVGFRGQMWFHVNFWARSRKSKKIKRFFAELHYKQPAGVPLTLSSFFAELHYKPAGVPLTLSSFADSSALPTPIPIVEICTIIEEPLSQYRHSCAFCPGSFDILHPKGCRKFVCGNDKDKIDQRFVICRSFTFGGMPFTGYPGAGAGEASNSPSTDQEEQKLTRRE